MLAVEKPDLVILALPNLEHFAPTLRLLQAKVPLIVEKPLVFDLKEADTLLAAAKAHELTVMRCRCKWRRLRCKRANWEHSPLLCGVLVGIGRRITNTWS